MLTLAWYLLKVMVCSGILFGYYLLALRNKKFHLYNRFYLLASVALSWLIPLVKINFWEERAQQPQVISLLAVVASGDRYVEHANQFRWNWNIAAMLIAVFVSVIFLTQLLMALLKIRRLIRSNPAQKWNDIHFVFTNAKGTPFSFFKYIFWSNHIELNSSEGEQILKHKLTHVQEKHSIDKIFLSLVLIVNWCNPFTWLIRKELNMIHEFIADEKSVENGDVHSFATMLLKTAFPAHADILTNSFFHSPIKRRLIMLTTIRNPRYSYLRRLMILPLLTVVILFFAFRLKEKKVNALYKQPVAASFAITENETPAQFPGGVIGWRRYLERNLNLNVLKEHKAPAGTYAPVIVFTVDKDGSISDVIAETKAGYGTEEEAIKLIKKGPKWEPAKKDGFFIDSKVRQTIDFVLSDAGALVYIDSIDLIKSKQSFENLINVNFNDTTKRKNKMISKVANVTFKNAAGNDSTISATITYSTKDSGRLGKGLILLDGKKITTEELNKIDPSKIKSISVWKGESAIKKYGEQGKDDVIEVTTGPSNNSYQQRYLKDQQQYNVDQQKQLEAQQLYEEAQKKYIKDKEKYKGEQQNYNEALQKYNKVFTKVENPPYYPNGMMAFAEYINSNIQYPKEAIQKKIEGAVLIQFIVSEEGKLTDFKKISDKGYGLEEEAIRLLKNSGEWKPGIQNGHKVLVQIQQQVIFELPKKS